VLGAELRTKARRPLQDTRQERRGCPIPQTVRHDKRRRRRDHLLRFSGTKENTMNLASFAFIDPTMFFATMTLKYGRHFNDDGQANAALKQIILRGPKDHDFSGDTEQIDYPLLGEWPSAHGLLDNIEKQIIAHIGAQNPQIGQVIVQSLAPDSHIPWLADNSAYGQRYHRFKLLVSPCTGGCWYSGAEALAPIMGNLTYVNHRLLSSAVNLGPVPQISLIVDARAPTLQ
jgi:hypothetical protein